MSSLSEHTNHEALSTLFERYDTLCRYCDNLFNSVSHEYSSQIHCAKGCASCCLLETVVQLEAHLIASYLQQYSHTVRKTPGEKCVFLEHDACLIYPVRPIICRTHGLPTRYPDRKEYDVCPLNFPGENLQSLNENHVLNAELITNNLMRLNLAFCLLTQSSAEAAEERISLIDILQKKYPLDRK